MAMLDLGAEDVSKILENIDSFPKGERAEIYGIIKELEWREKAKGCRGSLLEFVQEIDEDYKVGIHHRRLAKVFEEMSFEGKHGRVTVNMPPRFGKSMLTSIYFPAWFIGNFPKMKIMVVSHTADFATDFGRKVRNIVGSTKFQEIFPDVSLAVDSQAAGKWDTNKGGEFFSVGIGGAIAGRGADLLIIDDPHNEQDILSGKSDTFDKAYDWYAYGARPRLMPKGRVAIVATRWALNDLTGRVVEDTAKNEFADQWEVIEFPAIFNEGSDEERSLWPEQWDLEELRTTRATMPPFQWSAQYMQQPTMSGATIIHREWWKEWTEIEPPECYYTIMSLDTAAEKHNRADFTALTSWGIFDHVEDGVKTANIMLLDAVKVRVDYPELKKLCARKWKEIKPDWFVVEKKNSGTALYQELRANGVPVQDYTPTRATGDKIARLNVVSDIFSSGLVWYPVGRRWAEEVVDEVCAFPAGAHDDLTDTAVMALGKFRNGGFIRLPTDNWAEDDDFQPVTTAYYLWPLLIGFAGIFSNWGFQNALC